MYAYYTSKQVCASGYRVFRYEGKLSTGQFFLEFHGCGFLVHVCIKPPEEKKMLVLLQGSLESGQEGQIAIVHTYLYLDINFTYIGYFSKKQNKKSKNEDDMNKKNKIQF
jgi:hypothetical protein